MKLYEEHPEVYDKLYASIKDYEWEANKIKEHLPRSADSLVVFGCGTGLHDPYFIDDYNVTGVDSSSSMLTVARRKNPTASYKQGDISSVSLAEQFDVAICLFGVVSYLSSASGLQDAVDNMASHLGKDGRLIIDYVEPRRKKHITEGPLQTESYEEENMSVVRTGVARTPEPEELVMEYHTILVEGLDVTRFEDKHNLRHFSEKDYKSAFEQAGLDVQIAGEDWPLWVATK